MLGAGASQVTDGGLCHGAIGIVHLFSRAHRAVSDDVLVEAARRWLNDFLAPWKGAPRYRFNGLGFLRGAAGTGMGLLSSIDSQGQEWDRLLLLSEPGRKG